jgi:hypothetical protein
VMNREWGSARWFALRLCVLGAACLALVGCSGGTGELAGTVTYKDKPIHQGTVTVSASDGTTQAGQIQEDGNYTVTGIPTGAVKIGVSSPDPRTLKVGQRKKDEPPPKADISKWTAIPDKYSDFNNSGLTTTVKSGKNPYNIDLK